MTELAPAAEQTLANVSDILLRAARLLVDYPDALELEVSLNRSRPTLVLIASGADTGKLIGRNARMAGALRTLVDALTMRTKLRVTLLIQSKVAH